MTPLRLLLTAGFALPLAGCISFGPKVPDTLMSLTATQPAAVGTARTVQEGTSLTVFAPTVPQVLASLRVPVTQGPTAIAYLKDAQWVEQPNRLFRSLLAETITAQTGRVALEPRQYALAPGERLAGRLQAFGYDASAGAVVVTYDATLVRRANAPIETRRFEARVPVATEDAAAIAPALNQAANQVAGEVATWLGGGAAR